MSKYRSLTRQMLHYLIRPHIGIPDGPVRARAAWRGDEMQEQGAHRTELSPAEIAEIESAIRHARALGLPTQSLTADDFPLPNMQERIAGWRQRIGRGLGVQVIHGVPVDRWTQADSELFFWCLGLHLGIPGAQNPEGHLLGHVRDQGLSYDDPGVRGYRTSAHLSYHCDAADVVGLLCLQKAKTGGTSRFVSSVTVFNELLARRPDLVPRLFEPMRLDTRGEGGVNFFPISPCRYDGEQLRTFYHADYYRTSVQHQGAPELTAREHELLNLYDEIASTPGVYLDMEFERGDIQLLNNHFVLHSRTDYVDWKDPAKKRHLLRLWLSLRDEPSSLSSISSVVEATRLLGNLAVGRARTRIGV